jgi:hypothetical protein
MSDIAKPVQSVFFCFIVTVNGTHLKKNGLAGKENAAKF